MNLLAAWLLVSSSHACGGFFCSGGGTTTTTQTGDYGIVPVVQDAERILFRINEDATLTTFVEVGYQQRADVDFAWIIPIPDVIDVAQVTTTDAALFNALELATAPQFTFQWIYQNTNYGYGYDYGYGYGDRGDGGGSRGCDCGKDGASDSSASTVAVPTAGGAVSTLVEEDEVGVVVVDEAVVGPFAIEVITAIDAAEFALWLDANGYDLPEGAVGPLEHYIASGSAFLGVKLAPDVPEGPVDTLVFTCPAPAPTIPLILTSIASADDLSITAWILGDAPYVPTNWTTTQDIAPQTLPDGAGGTDYLARVEAATGSAFGKAFVLEYAGPTETLAFDDLLVEATIRQYPRITRYRGHISPWEMTVDPVFGPFPGLPDYDNEHTVELPFAPGSTPATTARRARGQWLLVLPLASLGLLLRRRVR